MNQDVALTPNEDSQMTFRLSDNNPDMTNTMMICRAGIDTCTTFISNALADSKPAKKLVFYSTDMSESEQFQSNKNIIDNHATLKAELTSEDPLEKCKKIEYIMSDFLEDYNQGHILVDITGFTHEELLIVIRQLYEHNDIMSEMIHFASVPAERMGSNLYNPYSEKCRSAIEFYGNMEILNKTHLIALCGPGDKYVEQFINEYEPEYISLGIPVPEDDFSENIRKRSLKTSERLKNLFGNNVKIFDYSPNDPVNVMKLLGEVIEPASEHNTIIAPLYGRLSTLGTGLFALLNPEVQICNPGIEAYSKIRNTETITKPSEIEILTLSDMLKQLKQMKPEWEDMNI